MSFPTYEFNSQHDGIVHCVKYDHYGKRVATGGSDGLINIFQIDNPQKVTLLTQLNNGHTHSVWDLSWSHPKYGNYLASCSYDNKVIIWKETSANNWEIVYTYDKHTSSVNKCEFAPYQYGLILLCCSNDGSISLHEYKSEKTSWISNIYSKAHNSEVNSISWGPALQPIDFQEMDNGSREDLAPMRFISGGNDGVLKVWVSHNNNIAGFEYKEIESKQVPIRDVAWMNYVGYSYDTIGVSREDGSITIWKQKMNDPWEITKEINIKKNGIKLSWSHCGTYLSACTAENEVHFYQENLDETWEEVQAPQF